MGMRDLAMDVQDLKGAVYHSWEMDKDSHYITRGMEWKDYYTQEVRRTKGQGVNLGHMKNYMMTGLYQAYCKDKDAGEAGRKRMQELVGTLARDDNNKIAISKAKNLEHLVAHCQVVRTKKKGFINILLRGT